MLLQSVVTRVKSAVKVSTQFLLFHSPVMLKETEHTYTSTSVFFEIGESYMALTRCYQGVHLLETEEK